VETAGWGWLGGWYSHQWRRQDFSLGGGRIEARRGQGAEGVWCEIFDYLILKWRIFMHISGILMYLF